jgi:hypothetical protein
MPGGFIITTKSNNMHTSCANGKEVKERPWLREIKRRSNRKQIYYNLYV